MHVSADDLLGQIRDDYPHEFELARLRLVNRLQAAEIDRLTAAQAGTGPVQAFTASYPVPAPAEPETAWLPPPAER